MGYKYPDGTKDVDSIIADVIATVAWVDLVVQLQLAHMAFPIKMNSRADEDHELFSRFQNYSSKYLANLTYREKLDMFFALVEFEDKQLRKDMKTIMIELGKIRNDVAHNAAISLIDNKLDLERDTVGAHIINKKYELFNEIFKRVEPFIIQLEKSME